MSSEALTRLARQAYTERKSKQPAALLDACFHPYANLNHTIRLRKGKIFLRISDVMSDAPEWALRAIIRILLLKLDRRKIPEELAAAYRAYSERPEVRQRIHNIRLQRGKKVVSNGNGKVYDLQKTFDHLNREYFGNTLRVFAVTWSRTRTRRILGHYDRCHDVIVISRSLDAEWVPPVLFRYILFHEMLHARLGDQYRNGKRYTHHAEFKSAERKFIHYREAQTLMKQFSARIR
jgi:hypothetical protein